MICIIPMFSAILSDSKRVNKVVVAARFEFVRTFAHWESRNAQIQRLRTNSATLPIIYNSVGPTAVGIAHDLLLRGKKWSSLLSCYLLLQNHHEIAWYSFCDNTSMKCLRRKSLAIFSKSDLCTFKHVWRRTD